MNNRETPTIRFDFSNKSKDVLHSDYMRSSEFTLLCGHNNLGENILKSKRQENDVRLKLIEIAPGIQDLLRILVERCQIEFRNEAALSAFHVEIGNQPIQYVRTQESDADSAPFASRKFPPFLIHIRDRRIRQIRLGQSGKPPRRLIGMAGTRGTFVQPSHCWDTAWINGKRGLESQCSSLAISLLS